MAVNAVWHASASKAYFLDNKRYAINTLKVAGSGRFALSLLQTQPPESSSREDVKASTRGKTDSQEARAEEHLWQLANEKGTMHALIIRSLSEARQRHEVRSKEEGVVSGLNQEAGSQTDEGNYQILHPASSPVIFKQPQDRNT